MSMEEAVRCPSHAATSTESLGSSKCSSSNCLAVIAILVVAHARFVLLEGDDRRRLRAHLALQTLGVHPHELRELLGSPQTSSRLWALLSEDGFPMAKRPADVSEPLPDLEARACVRRREPSRCAHS